MLTPDLRYAHWHKSSYSGNQGGECVEVAFVAAQTAVRDSKNPTGSKLIFTTASWQTFLITIKGGAPSHS